MAVEGHLHRAIGGDWWCPHVFRIEISSQPEEHVPQATCNLLAILRLHRMRKTCCRAGYGLEHQPPSAASEQPPRAGRTFCPSMGHTAPLTLQTASILISMPGSAEPWWGSAAVRPVRPVTGTALAPSGDR